MNLFTLIYYFFSLLFFIIALPFIIYLSSKPKYKNSILARFFLFRNKTLPHDKKSVWFHSCSLGETTSLIPLVKHLSYMSPSITVTTQTGFNLAKKMTKKVRFLPFEAWLPFWIRKQKAVVVLEAELWYMLFFVAKAKKMKTALLNARISDKSYKNYLKMRWFYKKLFKYVDKIFCQSDIDKERLVKLGAKNIEVIGNIKLANKIKKKRSLNKPDALMMVAACTHENEELLILDAFIKFLQTSSEDSCLIVVPRHPERFNSADILMQEFANEHNMSYHRYSQNSNFNSRLILVDTIGELINIYAISDIVILGGAFNEAVGGHNPLEAATFNNKIISGKHFFNQKELFSLIENIKIINNDELANALKNINNQKIASFSKGVDLKPFYDWIQAD